MTTEEIARERAFLKRWTRDGAKLINRVGGNFWMTGSDRRHCTIYKPERLAQLVEAGVLRQVGPSYQYIREE